MKCAIKYLGVYVMMSAIDSKIHQKNWGSNLMLKFWLLLRYAFQNINIVLRLNYPITLDKSNTFKNIIMKTKGILNNWNLSINFQELLKTIPFNINCSGFYKLL